MLVTSTGTAGTPLRRHCENKIEGLAMTKALPEGFLFQAQSLDFSFKTYFGTLHFRASHFMS